jgi:hypothetical protein
MLSRTPSAVTASEIARIAWLRNSSGGSADESHSQIINGDLWIADDIDQTGL